MDRRRYFDNPFRDYDGVDVSSSDKAAVRNQLLETAAIVFSKKTFDSDGGIYVGAAGVTYAYLHIQHLLTAEEKQQLLSSAQHLFDSHLKQIEKMRVRSPDADVDAVGFLLGKGGIYAVGAVLGKISGFACLEKECIRRYAQAASIAKPINFLKSGSDELFVGRAGYLLGVIWLKGKLELATLPVAKEDLRFIWNATINSGRKYAVKNKSSCPLMYAYYNTEYLGAAHGLSSILQVLLCFPEFLRADPQAEKDIRSTIDFYLTLQSKDGNFPCAMDEALGSNQRDEIDELIHWCHGAPGAVYLFAKAYLHYGDPKYLNACIACGEVVWQKGLLTKGPGICHGVAGNAYVFLLLHQLLKEPEGNGKYLYRAYKFAEFLKTDLFKKMARTPDNPYSLYEGLAGTLCFLSDLLDPDNAEFPFFNMNYNL